MIGHIFGNNLLPESSAWLQCNNQCFSEAVSRCHAVGKSTHSSEPNSQEEVLCAHGDASSCPNVGPCLSSLPESLYLFRCPCFATFQNFSWTYILLSLDSLSVLKSCCFPIFFWNHAVSFIFLAGRTLVEFQVFWRQIVIQCFLGCFPFPCCSPAPCPTVCTNSFVFFSYML